MILRILLPGSLGEQATVLHPLVLAAIPSSSDDAVVLDLADHSWLQVYLDDLGHSTLLVVLEP